MDYGSELIITTLRAAADELEVALRQRVCVVRCKACIHYDMTNNGVNGWCNELNIPTDVGDYCSFGEMKVRS